KAKARDIIAAIRTLKAIEGEHRHATDEERQVLARFPGFGPVALSIFPDPATGNYKDSWKENGQKLRESLTQREDETAERTTSTQFFRAPVVMEAMHEALSRLGVPSDAFVLEPGAGVGNFMACAPKDYQFIGVELDSISGRIAQARFPNHQIRIEPF